MPEPWTSSLSVALDAGVVTLVEGSSFCVSLASGDMVPGRPHGLFFRDTRFLSGLRLRVNGETPELLTARPLEPFSAAFVLRAPPRRGQADSHLMVFRHRYVGHGMREDLVVRNYGEEPAFCGLELLFDADFADLFEVKEGRVEKQGDLGFTDEAGRLRFDYTRGRFRRGSRVDFSVPPRLDHLTASWEVIVPRRGDWTLCVQVTPVLDGDELEARHPCGGPVERSAPSTRLERWRRSLPTVTTEHDGFASLLRRSSEDLAALRLFDPDHPDRTVVAAGAPWFMTVFGRDALLTSWMGMVLDPDLALGTLQTLAGYQGREVNPVTEEEPGRILHEVRFGESARLSRGGEHVYYGTVDATPLFVMLLGELGRWGTRRAEVDALLPAADRALAWIDEFGDRDGDGYVEYQRTSDRGLQNQGWKDSWDGVRCADGRLPHAPIALCEVQAYVYGALGARIHFADESGDHALAARLRARSADLKARFNRDFWLEDREWFAMGLDCDKAPIDAIASNVGHCLWTGIVDEDKARIVAERLLSDDLFSGWGIRTLASSMQGYNPISYHNGSVWPHDNAIAVAGLVRYGLVEPAHRVMEGVVAAGAHFGHRLPELFAGLSRAEYSFPVAYPTSCSPQAWAAAAPLLFLRSLLRFEPDVRNERVHVAPALPDWIGSLALDGVPLAGGRLSFGVDGDGLVEVDLPPALEIVATPMYGPDGARAAPPDPGVTSGG